MTTKATKLVRLTKAEYSRRLRKVVRMRTMTARCKALGELNRLWNLQRGGAR